MSEEESFIVLEETPSMLQFSLLDSYITNGSQTNSIGIGNGSIADESAQYKDANSVIVNSIADQIDIASMTLNGKSSANNKSALFERQSSNDQTPKITLAQSFLLGDINCDKMKSFLPSLGDANLKGEIDDLQYLIQERNDLKDALQRTNATMRQQYSMVSSWQNSVKDLKQNHDEELNKFRNINDELFQQNHELQEKVAELQHLAEMSRKTNTQEKEQRSVAEKTEIEQLKKQIKYLKTELASKVAINVESEEAQHETEVKLVAIQKLYQNSTAEIASLKSQNDAMRQELQKVKSEADELRDSVKVAQAQCDVYRNDFELERKQREEMACEREQMIADINMLKKRNEALLDGAQTTHSEASASASTSNASGEENNVAQQYVCPLCSNTYEVLTELESHVQSCLETNGH